MDTAKMLSNKGLWSTAVITLLLLVTAVRSEPEEARGLVVDAANGNDGGHPAIQEQDKGEKHDVPSRLPDKKHKLTERELRRMRVKAAHDEYHKKHAGHEAMHAEMFFIMIVTLVVAQFVLHWWKTRYFQSFQTLTLIGMWLFPLFFSIRHMYIRFISIWIAFTIATGFIIYRASRKPLAPRTPRLVYWYFFLFYKMSYLGGLVGYIMAVLDMVGLNHLFPVPREHSLMGMGILLIFYSLYYAVLSRDCADIAASRMVSTIGYASVKGLPSKEPNPNICACCGLPQGEDNAEKMHTLTCGHRFHEFCIRGWCIVGKKETCPFCLEKVDLKKMFPTHWARSDLLYAQLLDGLRYLVVWQPVLFFIIQGIIWILDLH